MIAGHPVAALDPDNASTEPELGLETATMIKTAAAPPSRVPAGDSAVTSRRYWHACRDIRQPRRFRAANAAVTWIALGCCWAAAGCGQVPRSRALSTAASPLQPSVTALRVGSAQQYAADTTASPAPTQPAVAAANAGRTIVRAQGGGFTLPPTFQVAADGGRHSRTPLPVSGEPQASVAHAGGSATAGGTTPTGGDVAPVQYQSYGAGTLPAPAHPYAAGQPPAAGAPPAGMPAGPPSLQAAPYGQPAAQPNYGAPTYGAPSYGAPSYGAPSYAPAPGSPAGPSLEIFPELNGPASPFTGPGGFGPNVRTGDVFITGTPARTGRIMLGGAVNSDAGLTGQITVDERNFDITRWPTSFQDLFSGTAFRGAGQTLRVEMAPGSDWQRYTAQFVEPNLLGYLPISMSLSAFLYDRRFQDWDENRMGGRANFGYRLTPDLSLTAGLGGQQVELSNPRLPGIPQIDQFVGTHDLYSGLFRLSHDTRNTPFGASQGHLLEWSFEQAFGDFSYPRTDLDYRRYFLIRQRPDESGKHTVTMMWQFGVSGEDTPVFENYFAGGYSTLRGFRFRGASPTIGGAQVGGRFSFIGSAEYMFPITADDAFRMVTFVDYGTVERDIEINSENFRVAPGVGLRMAIPALGPAPLAFDFAFPVAYADTDDRQTFSFYMSVAR